MEEYKENTEYPVGTIVNTKYGKAIVTKEEFASFCKGCIFDGKACSAMSKKCCMGNRLDNTSIYYKPIKEEEMEKGTVKLSLEDARELYNEGDKFKTIALSAYSEEELNIFKEGNFLVSGWNNGGIGAEWVCIYKKERPSGGYYYYADYIIKSNNGAEGKVTYNDYATAQTYTRLATEEEKQLLLNAMHKEGNDWDDTNKKIIPYTPPYEPKDGDFVTSSGGYPFIYKDFKANNCKDQYGCYLGKYVGDYGIDLMKIHAWTRKEGCRPSTEEEKQLLLSELHAIGKDWDPINKGIIPYKWKPELHQGYYTITFSFSRGAFIPVNLSWTEDSSDFGLYKKGLVFKTKKEAEARAKELNAKCNF